MSDFDAAEALARLERIQKLTFALEKACGDFSEQQELTHRIRRELAVAREALAPLIKHKLAV